MRRTLLICCALALAAAAGAGQAKKGKGGKMKLNVTSPAFGQNEYIPARHACGGEDVSPELNWGEPPAGTRSLAVVMDDPDAPPGTWTHWVLFDIPPRAGLPEGVAKDERLEDGSRHGACWGVKDADMDRVGYYGPCPPPGKPHRYFFKVYALDKMLGLPVRAKKGELLKAMKGHILAQGELVGLYKR